MNAVLAADLVNSTRYQLSTLLSGTRSPGPAPVFCSSAPLVSFVLSHSVPQALIRFSIAGDTVCPLPTSSEKKKKTSSSIDDAAAAETLAVAGGQEEEHVAVQRKVTHKCIRHKHDHQDGLLSGTTKAHCKQLWAIKTFTDGLQRLFIEK